MKRILHADIIEDTNKSSDLSDWESVPVIPDDKREALNNFAALVNLNVLLIQDDECIYLFCIVYSSLGNERLSETLFYLKEIDPETAKWLRSISRIPIYRHYGLIDYKYYNLELKEEKILGMSFEDYFKSFLTRMSLIKTNIDIKKAIVWLDYIYYDLTGKNILGDNGFTPPKDSYLKAQIISPTEFVARFEIFDHLAN